MHRGRVARGVYTAEGKVVLDEASRELRREVRVEAAAEQARKAAEAAEAVEATEAAEAVEVTLGGDADGDGVTKAADEMDVEAAAAAESAQVEEAVAEEAAAEQAGPVEAADTAQAAAAEAEAADLPTAVSLYELCAIAKNRFKRPKACVFLDEALPDAELPARAPAEPTNTPTNNATDVSPACDTEAVAASLVSLMMLDDPEGAAAGTYDKFAPKPPKAPKAPKPTKAEGGPPKWTKVDRDRAYKAACSMGVSDAPRLAKAIGRSIAQVAPHATQPHHSIPPPLTPTRINTITYPTLPYYVHD